MSKKLFQKLTSWQRNFIRTVSALPVKRTSLLTIPNPHGDEIEKFRDLPKALLSWQNKQLQYWHFSAFLKNASDRPFSLQLGFEERHFNFNIPYFFPKLFSSYFIVTDPFNSEASKTFQHWHQYIPFAFAKGFTSEEKFYLKIGSWCAYQQESGAFLISASHAQYSIHLELLPIKPLCYHGQNGYFQKDTTALDASYFCSQPRMRVSGKFLIEDKLHDVHGLAFLLHEKESAFLSKKSDFFFIQFHNNQELLLNLFYDEEQSLSYFSAGTWIDGDSSVTHLISSDIKCETLEYWVSPKTKGRYPIRRRFYFESLGLEIEIKPQVLNQQIYLKPFPVGVCWQGAITVEGKLKELNQNGLGFMKLANQNHETSSILPSLRSKSPVLFTSKSASLHL